MYNACSIVYISLPAFCAFSMFPRYLKVAFANHFLQHHSPRPSPQTRIFSWSINSKYIWWYISPHIFHFMNCYLGRIFHTTVLCTSIFQPPSWTVPYFVEYAVNFSQAQYILELIFYTPQCFFRNILWTNLLLIFHMLSYVEKKH